MPIRLRLTLLVAATTIALVAVAGLLGPRVLRASLVHAIDQDLGRRATPISRAVTDPDDDTVDIGDLRDEVNRLPESIAQVLDSGGRVLASSAGLQDRPIVPPPVLARLDAGPVSFQQPLGSDAGELVRVRAEAVTRPDGRLRAAVAAVPPDQPGGALHVPATRDELAAPVDADRLRQAADNLLDNALRVAPPGSAVRVRAERRDGMVAVAVSDAGPGFPPDFLPHAFGRFRRADSARSREHGGAGLGLAIVEAIARGHRGRAEATNLPDGGAEVRLLLPGT